MNRFIKTNIKDFINEDLKTIDSFYSENNIDPDNLSYLGRGDFGEAYSIGDGRVLKITTSKNEFELAKQIESKNIPGFATIYKTDIVGNKKLIILEELEQDSEIEDLFWELMGYLDEQGLPIQYLDHLDLEPIEISNRLKSFIDGLDRITRSYRNLGIEASDIQPDNLGYSSSGELKAFDIDDRRR
jgi:hypothetical protein